MASVLLRPDIILVHPFNIIVKCVQPGSLMFIHIAFVRAITVVFDIFQRLRQEQAQPAAAALKLRVTSAYKPTVDFSFRVH